MLRALFDGVDPGANLNPGKITGLADGGRGAQPWSPCTSKSHPAGWSPSRSTRPQTPEPAPAAAATPAPQAAPRT